MNALTANKQTTLSYAVRALSSLITKVIIMFKNFKKGVATVEMKR